MKAYKLTIITALLTALLFSNNAVSQNKGETKLYNSVVSKGDLKNLNKFLSKYPSSIYEPKITRMRDSIIFTALPKNDIFAYQNFIDKYPSSYFIDQAEKKVEQLGKSAITEEQAIKITTEILSLPDNQKPYYAKGVKIGNVENIIALISSVNNSGKYSLAMLKHDKGGEITDTKQWSIVYNKTESIYTQSDEKTTFTILNTPDVLSEITLNGEKYIGYNYTNSGKNNNIEYISNLFSLTEGINYAVMFSGKKEVENGVEIIEGSCMDAAQGGALSVPPMNYLIKNLGTINTLRPISKEKVMIDEAIEWWNKENNPNTSTLSFGLLPTENPIVTEFGRAKDKEKGRNYDVAFFDIRGTTVVVSYDKSKKQYSLIWCESAPKDTKKDKFLNTIYFENDSTIVLYYYKGNTTSKKRINLVTKNIR